MIDRPIRFVQVSRQEVTMAKVSVVIPVYNVEDYLRQCIESVLKQTLKDIDIICVDDGSTDSSLSILEEYASQDNRIKIIKQANGGAGAARNNGLRKLREITFHSLILMISLSLICWKRLMKKQKVLMHRL